MTHWLSPDEWTALRLSLQVSAVATLASLPIAILVAWALARGRFWGRTALDALVHLPLILPPVVTGYLLLLAFGRRGPIGSFLESTIGLVFSFRWTGAALAAAIMGFPLLVRAIRLAIEAVDPKLEEMCIRDSAYGFVHRLFLLRRRSALRHLSGDKQLGFECGAQEGFE